MKSLKERLLDLKEQQEKSTYKVCPMCGQNTMHKELDKNPMSAFEDIQICEQCSKREQVYKKRNAPHPLSTWSCFYALDKAKSFRNKSPKTVQQIVMREHYDSLEEAFLLYENRDETFDLEALRMDIYRAHKGLSHLTLSPVFRAQYTAKDGFFSVSFRKQNGKVLVAQWVEEQNEKELVTKK